MRRKIFRGVVVLAVLGLAFLGWAVWMSGILHRSAPESRQVASSVPSAAAVASQKAWAEPRFASVIARGEYLARAGDCVACHTMRGGAPYAGGLATPTPFGLLYSPNITPDKQYGIGNWTEDEFWRAMHDGIAPGNKLLYPVFPFTHFTKISRPDVDAIFAYLRSLPPAAQPNHPNEMPFPFNQRSTLVFWRALFFRAGEFKPDPKQSPEWNRGAYLVEGLGHCGMCHSSFNAL
ncbi:MAG: c-type cytochrome, partial [Metallibacterium scheffleri]